MAIIGIVYGKNKSRKKKSQIPNDFAKKLTMQTKHTCVELKDEEGFFFGISEEIFLASSLIPRREIG